MIYNKTLKIGCAYLFCQDQGKVALACVYEKRPIEGQPLYWADSKNNKGCTKDAPCKKLIKGAVCSSNDDGTVGPLCLQEAPPATEAPETITEEPESTTDEQESATDEQESTTDEQESATDEPESTADEPESTTDEQES
ncbi:unnamed protein product, partial [Cylicostephanus goldi]